MKTLFLSPQVPRPLDAGSKIRIDQLLRCYASLGEVTLVCFAQDALEAASVDELARSGIRVLCSDFVPPAADGAGGRFHVLRQAMNPQPRIVRYFVSAPMVEKLQTLLARESFDVMHVERLSMTQNATAALAAAAKHARPYLVIDVDDLESGKMKRAALLDRWRSPQKYLHTLEWLKLAAYERRMLADFDCTIVCSEDDRLRLSQRARGSQVEVFQNGAELDDRTSAAERDDGRTLVYLGAMGYPPNEDAVTYFASEIFPKVRLARPATRLIIAGKSPSTKVRALADQPGVEVTGYIEDKASVFDACTVFIVPLRMGGGTRIKILEAMAARKPVVSTAVGCEGIDVTNGENILIADHPKAFAAACVELLGDPDRRRRLGGAGRDLVFRSYRWEAIRARFAEGMLERLAAM